MSATRPKKTDFLAGSRARKKVSLKPTPRPAKQSGQVASTDPRPVEVVRPGPKARNRKSRWVAWSGDLSKIIAYGATLEEARDAARAKGEMEPALEPVQSRHRLA